MKYKLVIGAIIMMFCIGYGVAQQQPTVFPSHAPTYMELKMNASSDLSGLKVLYDSLKTEYDRRYFLSGLPHFIAEKKITISIPAWVNAAVIAGLNSNDPLCVFNAANTAKALRINCATELMATYKTVHNTFGSYEDMIKTAILNALCAFSDPNKQTFLNETLTKDYFSPLSSSFSALLNALESAKSPKYLPKLTAYSDSLNSLTARLQCAKEKSFLLQVSIAVLNKVNNLEKELGSDK